MRKEIQEWIEKGNRTEAVRLLEEWVGKHPADEEVALGRIVVCRRKNDGSLE